MKIFCLILLLFSAPAFADAPAKISFAGRDYSLQRLGRTLWVSPLVVEARAKITKGRAPDCEEFETRLAALKDTIASCATEPSAYCRTIGRSLYVMAENRTSASDAPDFTQAKAVSWSIEEVPSETNTAALTKAAATAGGVPEDQVRLNLEPRAKLNAVPTVTFGEDSLVRRVERVVQFGADDLAHWTNQGLVTRNAFAACDVQNGRAHFSGEAESSLSSTDLTPDAVIDTAWKAYGAIARAPAFDPGLSPVSQAYRVGFYLGRAMPELARAADPLLEIGAIFERLFEERGAGFRLKYFGSKESMRTQIYPDQTYRISLTHEWRL